jgi:hypothetical protein
MIERIVLNDPVTPNHLELQCECLQEDVCFKLFLYIEAYTYASQWIETAEGGYEYYIICQDCANPRHGDIVAYVDYKGVILASVYAEKWEEK